MFKYDSGLMTFLGKVTDIVILNLLTLLCCLPIVTIGASITAAHYTALKMHRDTDNYVIRNFFRSFKTNLLQGTLIWIMWVVVAGLSLFAYLSYPEEGIGTVLKIVMCSMLIFIAMTTMWLFPLQSRFVNKIGITIRNAFFFSCRYVFKTLAMLVITVAFVLLWFVLSPQLYWIVILFGISIPIYLCAMLYNKVFEKLEEQIIAGQNPEPDVIESEQSGEEFHWDVEDVQEQNLIEQNSEEQDVEQNVE